MIGDARRRASRGSRGFGHGSKIRLERLEDRALLANAIPAATPIGPAEALIGSTLDFTVGFANASTTQVGYGPYIDLELPATGLDGNDGVTFNGATYLGSAVTSTVLTFDGSGHATHPYAEDSSGKPVIVSGAPGDQLVVLQLPFGSVTPGQPSAAIDVKAALSNLARLNGALDVKATGGFRYGNDPLDNPAVDPSLIGATTDYPVTPTLVKTTVTYLGPENETGTGPDFAEQYLVTAVVAPGQTINNFQLNDLLPANLQFVSLDAASAQGASSQSTTATPTPGSPGGTLAEQFDKVVGTGGATNSPGTSIPADASIKFTFYAPRDDASSQPVLDLASGTFATSVDRAQALGTWTPLNGSQPTMPVSSNLATHTLTDKSVAFQKTVVDLTNPTAPRPGDVLSYTIRFQVSDFFGFENLMASDVFSDGQHLDATFAPTLAFHQQGAALGAAPIGAGNLSVGAQNTSDGTTTLGFNLSAELAARGIAGGRLLGGSIPSGGTGGPEPSATPGFGGTTGTIVFQTVIQQQYDYSHPAGKPYVVEGDILTNTVSATGNVLAYANLAPDGSMETDDSGTSVQIRRGMLTETIYAINGSTSFTSPPRSPPGIRSPTGSSTSSAPATSTTRPFPAIYPCRCSRRRT